MTDEEKVAAIRQKLPAIVTSLENARDRLSKDRREYKEAWVSLDGATTKARELLTLIGPYSKEDLATEL
jgi:hypothetical protein